MKFFVTALLFVSTIVFANPESILICETEGYAGNIVFSSNQDGFVTFLHSTGRIICPASTDYFIKEKSSFRCNGLWNFDHLKDENDVSGEPLSVVLKHDGKNYVATLRTSSIYGNNVLKMACK